MARYEAAKTVLSPKGRGSGVIKRKNSDDKSPAVKKEDLITVFSEKDDSSPETYKKAREYASELQRETRGMKKGGSVNENKMMKKMGRGMTKAAMQKVASKVVKGHEKRMHGMQKGGSVSASKRADGCAQRGKTKGRMV